MENRLHDYVVYKYISIKKFLNKIFKQNFLEVNHKDKHMEDIDVEGVISAIEDIVYTTDTSASTTHYNYLYH